MIEDIVRAVREAGVIGAGGAGFPTAIKIDAKCEYVIVNAAECEPLLRVDQQLIVKESEKILKALSYIVSQTGAKKGIIGIKAKHKAEIEHLKTCLTAFTNLELYALTDFYPAGDEQVLAYEVTGRSIPEGGIPLHVGIVVINVETLLNVGMAVENGAPVTQKYVTVTGAVKTPVTVKVPVGVTIASLIEMAGGAIIPDYRLVDGGPMMGKILPSSDIPVTKLTKGIIVLPPDHPVIASKERDIRRMLYQAKSACMHCGLCSEICPRHLLGQSIEPHKTMRIASYGTTADEKSPATVAMLCSECRLCEFACVMGLQPWKINSKLKQAFGENGVRNPHNKKDLMPDPYRHYKRYPVKKLIRQLGLKKYDVQAPLLSLEAKPECVELLTRQHIGKPATPVVQSGQFVIAGQIVAQMDDGALGANVHASIAGIVDYADAERIVIRSSIK